LSDLADLSDLTDLAGVDLAGVDVRDCSSRFLRSSVSPASGLTCGDYAP